MYSDPKGCQSSNFSTLDSIYYSPELFSINNNDLYKCFKNNKKNAIVCDGKTSIKQLRYTKTNCKGTSNKVNSMTLPVCQKSEPSSIYSSWSCSGPSHL